MADLKKNIAKSIGSARQWLAHAEDSFGNDREIRGELDLLLAQAELQRVREANRSGRWRKYSLFSHGMALGTALFIAVAGLGGAYWWVHAQKAVPVPIAAQSAASVDKPSVNSTAPSPGVTPQTDKSHTDYKDQAVGELPMVSTAEARENAGKVSVQPQPPVHSLAKQEANERPAATEVVLPPDEMQKLIRAAGKSLRASE